MMNKVIEIIERMVDSYHAQAIKQANNSEQQHCNYNDNYYGDQVCHNHHKSSVNK